MLNSEPLVLQIQKYCLDDNTPLVNILRKAKLVATKLELEDWLEWINKELDGYTCNTEDLPPYRIIKGTPKALHPYRGWQPIIFEDEKMPIFFLTHQ